MKNLQQKIIEASYKAGACHIGSALSCSDIIEGIFRTKKPKDLFIFSKASGILALYCHLYPVEKATKLIKKYPLPNMKAGCLVDGGSLGHGFPIACGLALADKSRDVYLLLSDAEVQEGTFWECLLFKIQHKLTNLKVVVDFNGFQACGKIGDILALPVDVLEIMGIKFVETIKGKGVSFMENKNEWHYKNLDEKTYKLAMEELK